MCESERGVYCAPLRLLAAEGYDILTERLGEKAVALVTGDDRRGDPQATHLACTVEMAPLEHTREIGVVDEVQLLGDQQRGWAWTRAVLGLPVRELHLCGSISALPGCFGVVELGLPCSVVQQYASWSMLHLNR